MTLLQAFSLGVLQGITEFLPVSSSGHLVLAETLFDLRVDLISMQGFNILLHAGTLFALVICYAKQWVRILLSPFREDAPYKKLLLFLVVATIPGAIAGLLLEEVVALRFSSVNSVAVAFLITAAILVIGERTEQSRRVEHLTSGHAILIGIAQAFALIPGISRSGFTIAAARMLRIKRKDALDFSFLLATPIIAGATAMSLWHLQTGTIEVPSIQITLVGFLSAFVASMLAIRFLRIFVTRHSLACFSWYLILASILLFVVDLKF